MKCATGVGGDGDGFLFGRAMTAAVFAGSHAAFPLERAGEVALVKEACFGGNVGELLVGRFKELAGGIEADGGEVVPWRHVEDGREGADEGVLRHAGKRDELFELDVLGGVLFDELRDVADLPVTERIVAVVGRKAVGTVRSDDLASGVAEATRLSKSQF